MNPFIPIALLCGLLSAGPLRADTLSVQIEGLGGELLDNVRASLGLERRKQESGLTGETIERLYQQAEGEIRRALEPFGRYRPQIDAKLIPPAGPKAPWRAEYRIEAGPQARIGEMRAEVTGAGEGDETLRGFLRGGPLLVGAPFDHRVYEQAKNDWLRFARRRGYLDAAYSRHRVEVLPEEDRAEVFLELSSGPRYRFGEVRFEQGQFSEDYLRSYLAFAPGDPFDADRLADLRRALSGSGHFDLVEVERQAALSDPAADAPAVPVRVRLETLKPNGYRGQLGYGTDTGFGLQLDWQRRYLGEQGHQLNADGVVVQDRNKRVADLAYLIPIAPLLPQRLELFGRYSGKDLTYQDMGLDKGDLTRIEDLLLGVRRIGKRRLWGLELEEELSLAYIGERYDIFQVLFGHLGAEGQKAVMDYVGADGMDTLAPSFQALVPGVAWSYRDADDRLSPRDGNFLRLEWRGARQGLGSNLSFWQARLRSVLIRPVRERDRLILRGELGYTEAETKQTLEATFNQMPEYYEFRTGGDRSVRGYEYDSLFPKESITGGKHLLVGSLEYEYALFGDWGLAVFYDLGDACNDFGALDLRQGVGIGARWRSPVGMVRLDLAVPLGETADRFRIHFTIGPEF